MDCVFAIGGGLYMAVALSFFITGIMQLYDPDNNAERFCRERRAMLLFFVCLFWIFPFTYYAIMGKKV